jgi:hypothetical protein
LTHAGAMINDDATLTTLKNDAADRTSDVDIVVDNDETDDDGTVDLRRR